MSQSFSLVLSSCILAALSAPQVFATPLMSASQDLSGSFQEGVFDRLSMSRAARDDTGVPMSNGLWVNIDGAHDKASRYYRTDKGVGGYKSDLGFVQFGYDHSVRNFRLGMALLGATGEIKGVGSENFKLKPDYFGIGLYGSWSGKKVKALADIGYLKGRSDEKNENGFPSADVWFSGLKFETRLDTGALDVVPYYGLRFSHVSSDKLGARSYSVANLWQFPLGVNAGYDWKCPAGWNSRLAVDLSFVPTAGNRKSYGDYRTYRIADSSLYRAQIGINVSKERHMLELKYGTGIAAHGRFDKNLTAGYRFMY